MSKPTRILYMEDDVGLARLLQRKLERAGYQVDLAHNGAEGLAMFKASSYDVVAVDQKMPGHDGLEVIRILSSNGTLPPTIMITGTGNEQIAIEAMKLGASDYIVKDVDGGYLELLPTVIEQVLYQQQLVTERQQMFDTLQQLNRNLALLNLAGQKLAATLDMQQIMTLLLQAVTETIGAEASSVWLIDDESDHLVCQAAFRYDHHRSPENIRLSPGTGVVGWVVQHGESLAISDAQSDARFAPQVDSELDFRTTSLLAVPLRTRDTVIGALEVVNKKEDSFDVDDQTLVETLASSAAIAIDNARLVESLRQHTQELQARNQELDAFAHTVAHDLKTPLGPLMGLTEILEMSFDALSEDDVTEILQSIRRSGRKMQNIVDELLLLAQVRDADVKSEPLDMSSILAEAEHRLTHLFKEYEAKITMPDSWPRAWGYTPWIEEVWVNYLSNGMKYGGQPPCLKLGADLQENGMARFWVKDNGRGLTLKEQERLFIPFTQLSEVRTEGHGLGLSIVQRIIEKLGGEVSVESEGVPGQGSIFSFTLPATKN